MSALLFANAKALLHLRVAKAPVKGSAAKGNTKVVRFLGERWGRYVDTFLPSVPRDLERLGRALAHNLSNDFSEAKYIR